MNDLYKFTYPDEFACPCCGLVHKPKSTLELLQSARAIAGEPFHLTSSCRCEKHNIEVGGAPASSHIISYTSHGLAGGWADDILVTDSRTRFHVLRALFLAGYVRIGIGEDFIHADNDMLKQQGLCWLYNGAKWQK